LAIHQETNNCYSKILPSFIERYDIFHESEIDTWIADIINKNLDRVYVESQIQAHQSGDPKYSNHIDSDNIMKFLDSLESLDQQVQKSFLEWYCIKEFATISSQFTKVDMSPFINNFTKIVDNNENKVPPPQSHGVEGGSNYEEDDDFED